MIKTNCVDCIHYHTIEKGNGSIPQVGECRFLPPKVFVVGGEDEDVMTTAFPMVAADEYCGAWDDGERYEVASGTVHSKPTKA